MSKSKVRLAVHNNAQWCLTIWQCHGLQTFQKDSLWSCSADVPDFYPNVVTMQPAGAALTAEIANIRAQNASPRFSVKDSFADLNPERLGLARLFDANWLYLAPGDRKPTPPDLHWAPTSTAVELARWESCWDGREGDCDPIFLPALLADPSVAFWAGWSDGEIKAGYISNVTGPVVGLSNNFGPYEDCVHHASSQFSDLGLVSYEATDAVSTAKRAGFDVIGDLTVWISA